jgi:hypothetical protein
MGKKKSSFMDIVVVTLGGGLLASLGVVGFIAITALFLALGALFNGTIIYILNFALAKVFAVRMFPFVKDLFIGLILVTLSRLWSAVFGGKR